MDTPALIYDHGCPYCTGIARITSRFTGIGIMPYQSVEAQDFLEEEFEDPGFTLYLVDNEKIFFGNRAAEEAAKKLNMSRPVTFLTFRTYPYLVKLFSILSRRKGVRQPVCKDKRCLRTNKSGGVRELENKVNI